MRRRARRSNATYREKINAYFDAPECRAELVEAIPRLIRIRSVREEPLPGMPFGPGPAAALAGGLKLAEELGFAICNYDNYVGTADLNDKETALHILYHLGTTGEGTGWTVMEPYTSKEVDDMLYGRGTDDGKGPVAAVLLTMKTVKKLDVLLWRNTRLLMDTNEEGGSSDTAHYYARKPYAPCALSPGAEFPLINIEKGSYEPVFTRSWPVETTTPRATEFRSGFRISMFLPETECSVVGLSTDAARPYYDRAVAETGVHYELREEGDSLHILCRGKGAHASLPEEGVNAITGLSHLPYSLSLAEADSTTALRALNVLFPHGDCVGKALGIAQSDELSGALILASSLLTISGTDLKSQFDSRVPICANDENRRTTVEASFSKFGSSVSGEVDAPHHVPANSPLVKALLEYYEQYIDYKGEYPAIGGSTYAHDIPGDVAFGCRMPGPNGNMYGIDKHICIVNQLTAAKIFTQATVDLCG